jgi:hypothetical protein
VNLKLSDGSMVPSEEFGYKITTELGDVITIIDQEFNYAVKLGTITTEQANTFMAKKGFPILENGSKFGLFRVFGHHGEHAMKDCFTFFPEGSVKSFCFAFKGKFNGFTISKNHLNFIIDLDFLKSFLGMTKTFDATVLGEFPAPKAGKAPVAAPAAKVSSASSWVSVAKSNTPIKAATPISLEDIQDEEEKLNAEINAKLSALSIKKEMAKKAAAEELQRLEEEEKAIKEREVSIKAREIAIKDRKAKLEKALQTN